ncbi:MAG: zinc-finger domain-containing protein [Alphaproteobacteria bacterium]|nr:zinc-finger domain-containing protein [Alphaproteobacteria bacterium]
MAQPPAAPKADRRSTSAMQPPETVEARNRELACDGGASALGHPRVFLNMGAKSEIDCPYCGRHFVLAADVPAAAGH